MSILNIIITLFVLKYIFQYIMNLVVIFKTQRRKRIIKDGRSYSMYWQLELYPKLESENQNQENKHKKQQVCSGSDK